MKKAGKQSKHVETKIRQRKSSTGSLVRKEHYYNSRHKTISWFIFCVALQNLLNGEWFRNYEISPYELP